MSNREEVLKELDENIKYCDDEYNSYVQDADIKYISYCNKIAHIGTMLEYMKGVLEGKYPDKKYVDKYLEELEYYVTFHYYEQEFIDKLKKELEWIQ